MDFCSSSEQLRDFLAGRLDPVEEAKLLAHLTSCPICSALLDTLTEASGLRDWSPAVRAAALVPEPPGPEIVRLLARLKASPPNGSPASLRSDQVPQTVGPYRVLGEQGRGGMGIVLRAYDPSLERIVAVKILQVERIDQADQERFVREARATAGIHHDGVVQIYEVEVPTDAPPYLVMEFLDGPTLRDRILGEHRLDPREAAGIALQIAEALAAAHRVGLIHRDVKPTNVILDAPSGRAKLVDFGLARSTRLPDGLTREGVVAGTPEYMSPEQLLRPREVDARSDLYGLGVTLYEALTGECPFRGTVPMVLRQIQEDEPTPPRRLVDRVPRDLETICLKCLEKEPDLRYADATVLAADLRRFLAGEPVRARPVGRVGRFWRWCRRRPAVAILGASLALVCLVGIVLVLLAWGRERRALERAEGREELALQAISNFREAVLDNVDVQVRPELKPLRERLLREPLGFYSRLRQDLLRSGETRPATLTKLARANLELGAIIAEIGTRPEAIRAYQEAITLLEPLDRASPGAHENRSLLANALGDLGMQQCALGQADEAKANLERASALHEALVRDHPASLDDRADLARSLDRLGLIVPRERSEEAIPLIERAIAIFRTLASSEPSARSRQTDLALTFNHLGIVHRAAGHPSEAQSCYNDVIAILEALNREPPEDPSTRHLLAVAYYNRGNLRVRHHFPGWPDDLEQSRILQEPLVRDYPAVTAYRAHLAKTCGYLGLMLDNAGRRGEALIRLERSRDLLRELVRDDPTVVAHRRNLALTDINLGTLQGRLLRVEEAQVSFRDARDVLEELLRSDPKDLEARYALGVAHAGLGDVLEQAGKDRDALAAYREATAQQRQVLSQADRRDSARGCLKETLWKLVAMHCRQGEPIEAIAAAQELEDLGSTDPRELYELARAWALCIPFYTESDAGLSGEEHEPSPTFADRAIEALRLAIRNGFRDIGRLRRDPDMDSLRSNLEFQLLMMDLAFPADPIAR